MSYSTSKRVRSRPSCRFDLVDQEVRKHEAAFLMLGVRQRIESFGKRVLIAYLVWAHIPTGVRKPADEAMTILELRHSTKVGRPGQGE